MDAPYRLKIKIGNHEFEAEGEASVVQRQFEAFKELVASAPKPYPQTTNVAPPVSGTISDTKNDASLNENDLAKIMDSDGRVISLTVRANSVDDAVLLLIFGQKIMNGNELVGGGEIMDGITATGGFAVSRVDRLLEKMGDSGDLIVMGERRSKRYRLTNAGLAKARQIAVNLLALVA
jgi:hypothetical protein